jgi:hypothetical protein
MLAVGCGVEPSNVARAAQHGCERRGCQQGRERAGLQGRDERWGELSQPWDYPDRHRQRQPGD